MTAVSEFEEFGSVTSSVMDIDGRFSIDETYWGYIVRSTERVSIWMFLLQIIAGGLGVLFCLATLGMWLMPSAVFHSSVMGMKIGASVLTLAMAAFCLWFASRGTESEIQIDTTLGELREVVRNRAGRPTLLGRYGFDAIGSVAIEVGMERNTLRYNESELVLQYRNTTEKLYIARGAAVRLGALRDRIGRDLMLGGRERAPAGMMAAA